jgi:uncharacterized protein YcbK (DUF882 family)
MKSRRDDRQIILNPELSRRHFIKLGLISAGLCLLPETVVSSTEDFLSEERKICVYNLHTKEYIDTVYWKNGQYVREALSDFNYIFRDHYTGVVRRIDRHLLDLLFALQQKLNCNEPFHLISGYRTAKTNARLRAGNRRTARKSFHIYGKAADIRIPGISLKVLRRVAFKLKKGGVGFYPRANFVHVDTGKIRYWNQYS